MTINKNNVADVTLSILGCGWLGLPLGKELHENGYRVKGSTTRKEKISLIESAGIVPFRISLTPEVDGENLNDFFSSDILIVTLPPGRAQGLSDVYAQKIEFIANEATKGTVKWVIFTSSTSVYGFPNSEVDESSTPHPETTSGKVLAEVEQFLLNHRGFDTTIVRLGGLVGGERKPGRFLSGKKKLPNGDTPVNLVRREDCIGVIQSIIEQGARNEIFNIVAPGHPDRKTFYTRAAQSLELPPPEFETAGEKQFKIVSSQKAIQQLGYAFKHPNPLNWIS